MLRKVLIVALLGSFLVAAKTNATAEDVSTAEKEETSIVKESSVTKGPQIKNTAEETSAAEEVKPETKEASATQEEWNPPSAGPITTWTAPLCGKGKFVIRPAAFYNRTRGEFNDEGHYEALPRGIEKYQYQEQLFMQYGITGRLEIDAEPVYQENYIKNSDGKAHDNGFGDSYLFLRYCGFEEKGWIPCTDLFVSLKMPTGKYQHLDPNKLGTDSMGTGSWDPGIGVIMTKKLKPFMLHADALYSFPQRTDIDGVKTRYANYLNLDGAVEYFLPKGFNLTFEVNGFLQGDRWSAGATIPGTSVQYLTICPGIGWSNNKIQTLIGYQRVALGKNTDANDSVVLTFVYTF
jgi:hypothetical protein